MQDFFNLFSFDYWQVALIITLASLVIIQIYFYFSYYKLPYKEAVRNGKTDENNIDKTNAKKVSVIIASENEAQRLSKLLPVILEQDYPNFEVIVVSDGSTDETDEVLTALKVNYKNLYSTYVPYSNDKKFGRRKLAYTLGVKAATGDVLLFTEPHSVPVSKDWIYLMTKDIDDKIEVVLGVSYFGENNLMLNRLMRFDNYLLTMRYLSKALKGTPFTGVYRNVAYKRNLFFENKGFSANLALENAEDAFINQIVNSSNTTVCLYPDAFTEANIDNNSLWKSIKKNYSLAKTSFKEKQASVFNVEIFSRILFYVLFVVAVAYSIYYKAWGLLVVATLLFLIRSIIQLVIINKGSKYFKSGKYYLSLIVVDLLEPVYNLKYRTRSKRI